MNFLEFGDYKTFYIGKLMGCTKIAHLWTIYIDNKKIPIEVKESKLSKKLSIAVNKKILIKTKTNDLKNKNGYIFFSDNLNFKIKRNKWNKMDLYINDFLFSSGENINLNHNYKRNLLGKKKKKNFIKQKYDDKNNRSSHSSLDSEETFDFDKFDKNNSSSKKNKNYLNNDYSEKNSFDFDNEKENTYQELI